MATFKTVSWQPDDEVTSAKLDQMCQNTTWLKDNLILGDAIRVGSNGGEYVPSPMQVGSSKILRIDGKVKPFNSVSPTAWMDMDMEIPPGYSNLPIVVPAVADPGNVGMYVNLTAYKGVSTVTFRITQADHIAKRLYGNVHAIFIGY